MYTAERVTLVLIVLFMCGFTALGLAAGYPRQAVVFPLVVSALATVFAAVRLWEISRTTSAAGADASAEELTEIEQDAGKLEVRAAIVPFLWVFGALVFLWLFGFLAGLTLYVLVFLLAHDVGWLRAVLGAAGMCAFVYVIFQFVLQVLLPVGLIPGLLGM